MRVTPHARRPGRSAAAGRDHAWAVRVARSWLAGGGSVLLLGSPGVDRSSLLEAAVHAGEHRRILRCTPGPDEVELPLCGLARLLSALGDDELEALTAAHRRALVALLYGGADPDSIGALAALRLAALRWFQTLAASGPLLLVLDEVQWLDDASADVLWFVSRRFDRLRIQMAAAEQVAHDGQPLGRQLCPPGTLEIRLDPLGRPNVTHYVRRRR